MQTETTETSTSTFKGLTPVKIAEQKKYKAMKTELLEFKELAQTQPSLHRACHTGTFKAVKTLLANNINVNELDCRGNCCMHWAVIANKKDLVIYLLKNGAVATIVNQKKESLLHTACILGYSEMLDVLLEKTLIDTSLQDSGKRTALERIAENGDIESFKVMVKHKVPLAMQILPIAASFGRTDFIK